MKIDKQVRNISDRLDSISNYGNGKYKHHDNDDYDDDYYLDRNDEPPRFVYYRHVRIEQCTDEYRKESCEAAYDTITQDELDYGLKRQLRMTPEQRYQAAKEDIIFHELYYLHQTIDDRGECIDIVKEYGCGKERGGCVPECRFYPEYGRIEDDKVIAGHKKLEDELRKDNKIVDIPLPAKNCPSLGL